MRAGAFSETLKILSQPTHRTAHCLHNYHHSKFRCLVMPPGRTVSHSIGVRGPSSSSSFGKLRACFQRKMSFLKCCRAKERIVNNEITPNAGQAIDEQSARQRHSTVTTKFLRVFERAIKKYRYGTSNCTVLVIQFSFLKRNNFF